MMIKHHFLSYAVTNAFHSCTFSNLLPFLITCSFENSNSPHVPLDQGMRISAFVGSRVEPLIGSSLRIFASLCQVLEAYRTELYMFSTGMKASPVIQLLAGLLALTILPCLAEGKGAIIR